LDRLLKTEDSVFAREGSSVSCPSLKENQVPSYRLHKQSGQAIVTLNGRDILVGRHGSTASKCEYRRVTSE
jgi:hypothetical protein